MNFAAESHPILISLPPALDLMNVEASIQKVLLLSISVSTSHTNISTCIQSGVRAYTPPLFFHLHYNHISSPKDRLDNESSLQILNARALSATSNTAIHVVMLDIKGLYLVVAMLILNDLFHIFSTCCIDLVSRVTPEHTLATEQFSS